MEQPPTTQGEQKDEALELVRHALNQLSDALGDLSDLFVAKISQSEESNFVIKDLRNQLSLHEKDFHFSIIKPIIYELIDVRETLKAYLKTAKANNSNSEYNNYSLLIRQIDIGLEKFNISSFEDPSDIFNPQTQLAVEVVLTSDPLLVNKIAERVNSGYYRTTAYKKIVFKTEIVKVYKENK